MTTVSFSKIRPDLRGLNPILSSKIAIRLASFLEKSDLLTGSAWARSYFDITIINLFPHSGPVKNQSDQLISETCLNLHTINLFS